jgi:uncharacterized membrane-anchored protein
VDEECRNVSHGVVLEVRPVSLLTRKMWGKCIPLQRCLQSLLLNANAICIDQGQGTDTQSRYQMANRAAAGRARKTTARVSDRWDADGARRRRKAVGTGQCI